MRAVLLDGFGSADVLRIGQAELPEPQAGQLLIRVRATSVNRPDIVQRESHYPPPPGESEILGLEAAGVVEALGPGTQGFELGERVLALVGGGGYAEHVAAHASHTMRMPETMSFEQAACVCETYVTAYLNLFLIAGLEDGETALLHGGGGGVNTAGIQLCKALKPDVRVIVTASPRKVDRVKALGADLVVDYRNENFTDAVRAATGKRGADVILDHIGGRYLSGNLKALATSGRLVIIGVMGGAKGELNLAALMVKRQRIIGSVLRSRPLEEKAEIIGEFDRKVMPLFAQRRIEPLIDRRYPLAQVADAHRRMENGEHFGKIVLTL